jgi:hypothetical protein
MFFMGHRTFQISNEYYVEVIIDSNYFHQEIDIDKVGFLISE